MHFIHHRTLYTISGVLAVLLILLYVATRNRTLETPLEVTSVTDSGSITTPLSGGSDFTEGTTYTALGAASGDTLLIRSGGGTKSFRLFGVRAPSVAGIETGEVCHGVDAKNGLGLMVQNTQVTIRYDSGLPIRDENGITTGYVYLSDGTLLNKRVLERGYAREAFAGAYPYAFSGEFTEAERSARLARRGLWAGGCDTSITETPETRDAFNAWIRDLLRYRSTITDPNNPPPIPKMPEPGQTYYTPGTTSGTTGGTLPSGSSSGSNGTGGLKSLPPPPPPPPPPSL